MTNTPAVYDLSQILNYPIWIELNSWNSVQPLHWASYNNEGLITEGQFLQPPGLPLLTMADSAGKRASDALPESILAVAALMPSMSFELVQACVSSAAAEELADDAPLLLIFVVQYARQQAMSIEAFNLLLAKKRSVLLAEVGLPGSKSLARLIRRLSLKPLLPWELEDIRLCLQRPEYLSLMRHHPHLHLNHFRLLSRIRQPLWPGLLNLVSEHTSTSDLHWLCQMIRDTLAMARGNEHALDAINSREELQTKHDRLVEQINRANSRNPEEERRALAKELNVEHGDYPAPPLAPIPGIEPLCSWLELLEEGSRMDHCVDNYDIPVAEGAVFIYRMLVPERLTISVTHKNQKWVVDEVRGAGNSAPSEDVLDDIHRWVAKQADPVLRNR